VPPGGQVGHGSTPSVPRAQPLADVDLGDAYPRPTGLSELGGVLGGGLVPGSVTLIGGEPGVGKSTLLLQVLTTASRSGRVLLVAAEESAHQVRLRAERIGTLTDSLLVLATTDLDAAMAAVEDVAPGLVVVDSIQTISSASRHGVAGSLAQVRACADALAGLARSAHVPLVLVSHLTKEGTLAGPRALEHLVDTVVMVEGDRHHALRTLRTMKHRFGSTGELGLCEMTADGLGAVADPHRYLIGDRNPGVPGSVILPTVEGQRALLVEVQALMAPVRHSGPPRCSAQGLDAGRLSLVRAVLDRRAGVGAGPADVFASVVGGVRVTEPAADLALALALASAWATWVLPDDLVVFGEVGLGGEVRQVPHSSRRLTESQRTGFRRAIVPEETPDGPPGLELARVGTVREAIALVSFPWTDARDAEEVLNWFGRRVDKDAEDQRRADDAGLVELEEARRMAPLPSSDAHRPAV
jgi:DNA repair protein RadA/Sms